MKTAKEQGYDTITTVMEQTRWKKVIDTQRRSRGKQLGYLCQTLSNYVRICQAIKDR